MKNSFFFTLIFITFSFLSVCQTAEQLMQEYDEVKKSKLSSLVTNKENEIIKWLENNTDIGVKYYSNKEYILAEPYFKKSLEIIKRVFGTTNQPYIVNLNNLAILYKESGDLKSSEDCYKSLVEITKITFGEDNIEFYYSINGIAYMYYDSGDWKSAEPYLKLSLELSKKLLGEEHNEYSGTLNNLGYLYYNIGDYKSAEFYFKSSLEIKKKYLGDKNKTYANACYTLGILYYQIKDYKLAEPLLIRAQEILKNLKIEKTNVYTTILSYLGEIYLNNHNYKSSESSYTSFLEIKKSIDGTENEDYAKGLYNLGILYSEMDNYKLSEKYYKESIDIRKKILGEEHLDYISSITNLGTLYLEMKDFENAEVYFKKSLNINEKIFGNKSIEFASSIGNLGILYIELEDYINAKIYLEKSIEIHKQAGLCTLEYANLLNAMGSLNMNNNDYLASEKNFKESLKIKQKLYGELNLECANELNNLSLIYAHFSNFNLAEEYLKKSLYLIESSKGKSSLDYFIPLNNLALLYLQNKDYENSAKILNQCLEIINRKLGTFNKDFADCLYNIAVNYFCMGDYKNAILCEKKALDIYKKLNGDYNLDYARCHLFIGLVYYELGDFKSAETSLKTSLLLYDKILGQNNLQYSHTLLLISFINLLHGDDLNFSKNYKTSADIRLNEINNNFNWFSESERIVFWHSESILYNEIISTFISINSSSPYTAESLLNIALISKGLMLDANRNSHDFLKTNKDIAMIASFNSLKKLRKYYSKLTSEGSNEFDLMKKINHEADSLDLVLSRKMSGYSASKKRIQTNWLDVQSHLNLDEIAIEFEKYFDEKDSTYHYMAMLINLGDKHPQLIKLCSEKELKQFSPKTELNAIYDLVWKPLLPSLTNVNTIYYSPSGILNNIPFQALYKEENGQREYVMDKFTLHQLTSTRYLALDLKKKEQETIELSIALFGGINYNDYPNAVIDTLNSEESSESAFLYKNAIVLNKELDSTRTGASYLPGTKKEVETISDVLNAKQWQVDISEGKNATENKIKSLSGNNSKSILHIATHGFAYPDKKEKRKDLAFSMMSGNDKYKESDNPMIRSGLLFGGANITWQGKGDSLLNKTNEDGVLTAYELSQLDLSNTKLAVLSACETGKGAIQGSEGTFGLKRALKLAGVDNMIVSLWKVPDDATMEMMTIFYTELANTKKTVSSFEIAQKAMRVKYPNEPKKWAGFVFVR